jgi:hypothetical protein
MTELSDVAGGVDHVGARGTFREFFVAEVLRPLLPGHLGLGSGIVIDGRAELLRLRRLRHAVRGGLHDPSACIYGSQSPACGSSGPNSWIDVPNLQAWGLRGCSTCAWSAPSSSERPSGAIVCKVEHVHGRCSAPAGATLEA